MPPDPDHTCNWARLDSGSCCVGFRMMLALWLLWSWLLSTLGGPVPRSMWFEEPAENRASGSSFHRLPVFLHAPRQLVPRDLFQPVRYSGPVPAGLSALLIPPTKPQEIRLARGARAVEVVCGAETVSVRVERSLLRAWTESSRFRLGSCGADKVTPRFLYFQFSLMECGGQLQVAGGELIYTYYLSYTPPPQGYVIRSYPLNLPIHCRYDRFHYSYKVGYRPQVQHTTFLKSIKSKLTFSLTVCNAQWEPLPPGHVFFIGDPVYFLAQTRTLLPGERLYVDFCYASGSEDPSTLPKVDIISNFGCMTESRREGSGSKFLSGGAGVVKFSVDAFLLKEISQVQYLHCSLSVGLYTSHIAKSCSYNKALGRWEELSSSPSVCSCCDSVCSDTGTAFKGKVRSSGWLVEQKHLEPEMRVRAFQTEKDTEPVDEDEKDDLDVHEDFQTGSEETKGETTSDRIGWKSVKVNHEEKADDGKENEEVMIKIGSELKDLLTKDMSDENRPVRNETVQVREKEQYFKDFVVSSNGDGKTVTSIDGFGNNTSRRNRKFDIYPSSTRVISTNTVCPNSFNDSCNAAKGSGQSANNSSNGHGIIYRKLNIPRSNAKDAPTHFTLSNFDTNTSAFSDQRLTKGSSELDGVSTALKLKEIKCINKPDSVNSELDEGDNLQIREFESERSAQPSGSRDLICSDDAESDLNSGAIGEALHWSLFTGEMDAD